MSLLREPDAEPIPGYRLIEPLGSGGFGEVWKCTAPGGLFKAIKFVFGNLNSLDVDATRAEQEFKALERIKSVRHAFILPMDRIENFEGELVIVMELADKSLHDLCEENKAAGLVGIPRDELIRYIRDAADGLDWMSEKHRLQHLDIKPRNLFIVADRVKVADFGLVKAAGASGILGAGVTPLYAPPETFSGKIDRNSDQYSLAIVYQELLTGQRPFNGKNARQLAHQHMNEEPDLRTLPEAERPIVARALSKDPSKRFPSCMAFVGALYHARSPAPFNPTDQEIAQKKVRPKSMADTMEDIQLGQFAATADDILEAVELGALPEDSQPEEVSELGMTNPQPDTGSIRPTLVIGVGSFGKRALIELRCRLLDRFGDLSKLPLLQFVYLETDPEAIKAVERGAPEVALQSHEVAPLPLHPFGHYRRRQLDQLAEWLPREKLYAIPRSLRTQGSRALGRLAFADNYLRLMARLRRQLLAACHPDALYHTVSETGLALRDATPRVYVLACASGGGSGYLTDLAYSLRRLLQQLRHPEAPLTAMLFCGAPEDPATPASELANLHATLTELNHFNDPALPFTAQYGADGPRIAEEGRPFDQTYLLTLPHRTPEGRRDVLLHLGSYLYHELTTPLGLRLDRCRLHKPRGDAQPAFRTLGTYGVWFPRGLLLRAAGRAACIRLLDQWQATEAPLAMPELDAAQARVLSDPELAPEALAVRVSELVAANLEGPPSDLLSQLLTAVEEQSKQSVAHDDPGAWARHALQRVQDWLGSGVGQHAGTSVYQRKSRLTRALETAAEQLAIHWDERFRQAAFGLMEHPGRRVAVGEAALVRLEKFCHEACTTHAARLQQLTWKTRLAQEHLQGALENCLTGGSFSWFGGGTRRALRVFVDYLAAFARQCLAEDLAAAGGLVYAQLRGRLAERARDLTFCRQRLRRLQEELETFDDPAEETGEFNSDLSPTPIPAASAEAYWESVRDSATARLVLPDNEEDLERAGRTFLKTLEADQWGQLDQVFGDQVLAERGGLYQALVGTNDRRRHLSTALLNQAVAVLGKHLPITDVAQVEFTLGDTAEGDVRARMKAYHAQATPLVGASVVGVADRPALQNRVADRPALQNRVADRPAATPTSQRAHTFLLIPTSDAGRQYGDQASHELPGIHLVKVPGQADLMFCREQNALSREDLERLLRASRTAYDEAVNQPTSSPHARFDIGDWLPLDP